MTATEVVGGFAGMLFGGWGGSPATAQQPAAKIGDVVGRYQISSFGFGNSRGGQSTGAYVLDTATVEVFEVTASEKPRSIGTVPKK